MALAYDASSESSIDSTDPSWTHTPVGVPCAVIVYVFTGSGTNDRSVTVTYGGVSMTAVSNFAVSGTTDQGRLYSFELYSSISTGAQTVAVNHVGTNLCYATAITVTGSGAARNVAATGSGGGTSPTVSMTTTKDGCFISGMLSNDQDSQNPGNGSGCLTVQTAAGTNGSTNSNGTAYRTTNPATGGTSIIWSQSGAGWGGVGLAIEEVVSGPATLKTLNTTAAASVKTMDGVAIASIKTIDTVA